MKKFFIVLMVNCLFIHTLSSQSLIQQIENAYNSLDTISYIENIILLYKENLLKEHRETQDLRLKLRGVDYNNMGYNQRQKLDSINKKRVVLTYNEDLTKKKVWEEIFVTYRKSIATAFLNLDGSIQQQNIYDSIVRDFSKIWMERSYSMFISKVKDKPVHFVLNLMFEKHDQYDQYSFFQPDTSKLPFSLIYFDKRFKPQFYINVVDGKFVFVHEFFPTFSKQVAKNVPKIYRRILRKNPKYLLNCADLEGGNTICYVLNDEIYIYRILQMKEYKLDDYIKKFLRCWND